MQITVVFEHWHLGDGNYPAFARGDTACLSFEMDIADIVAIQDVRPHLMRVEDAEYECVARVVRLYPDGVNSHFAVFETDGFRFYSPHSLAATLRVGDLEKMTGRLALDHYLWVEFLDRYADPPNLFYVVSIDRIRHVRIPERFIQRTGRNLSSPTALNKSDYGDGTMDVSRVDEGDDVASFSLFDLTIAGERSEAQKPTFFAHDA